MRIEECGLRAASGHVIEKLRNGFHTGDEQVVSCAGAGDVSKPREGSVASLQRPLHFPAGTLAFNSANQFCTTTMPAVAFRSRATFSLIIKNRWPFGATS